MSLYSKIAMLRGRTAHEIFVRGSQALWALSERLALRYGVSVGRQSTGLEFSGLGLPLGSAERSRANPRDLIRLAAVSDPDAAAYWRSESLLARAGGIRILGHGEMTIGVIPDWHRDPQSRIQSPRIHWSKIDYLDPTVVGDHKVLWEVNRHQYLVPVALSWLLDDGQEDLDVVFRHLSSWLDQNPPFIGVNWASNLEVSYRAISWCWLLELLAEARWPDGLRDRLLDSLHAHGCHIERYFSHYFSPNTHLTGEALGLFYIGSVLRAHPKSGRWRRRGADVLETWIDRHVLPDGVYFERATQYQRYTIEIYLHYLLLASKSGWPASPRVSDALGRLCRVLKAIAGPDDRIPLFGDDDGGTLMPIDGRSPDFVRGLLSTVSRAIGHAGIGPSVDGDSAMAILLVGRRDASARDVTEPPWTNAIFPVGGMAVLRDGWSQADDVAVIDCGAHGVMNCGHAHADALSMVLALRGLPLFVDRGTYTYVGAERDEFRCTGAHNTIEFDEQSSVEPKGPFQWGTIPAPASGSLMSSDGFSAFHGTSQGHVGTSAPSRHSRWVVHFRRGAWLVLDVGKRDDSKAVIRWQLAAGLRAYRLASSSVAVRRAGRDIATVIILNTSQVQIRDRDVSPRFGSRLPAEVLEAEIGPDICAATLIIPKFDGQPASPAEIPGPNNDLSHGFHWEDELGWNILWRDRPAVGFLPLEGWELSADAVWWRGSGSDKRGSLDEPSWLVVINGRQVRAPGLVPTEATANSPVRLFERKAGSWIELILMNHEAAPG